MADPAGISGIRATGLRPVAVLKKDNYRAWSMKLKVQLKVMKCWNLVTGVELEPAATGPAGCDAAVTAAAVAAKASWVLRKEASSAVLVTSISDEELHTIDGVDEEPVQIWARLSAKFDRKSEAQAEACLMLLLDFTHQESETADDVIERYETTLKNCLDQGVVLDNSMRQRMLLMRPLDRYRVLKQNYMLADAAAKPDLEVLKCQLRDIDLDLVKPGGAKIKDGQGYRAEGEANWGQKSNSGRDKGRDKNPGRGDSSGGRGRDRRGNGERGSEDRENSDRRGSDTDDDDDVTCFCCGKRGHIRPDCPKGNESCRKCGKIGHLRTMCKSTAKTEGEGSGGSPAFEAGQFEDVSGFAFTATIGMMEAVIGESGDKSQRVDVWLGDSGAVTHPAVIVNSNATKFQETVVVDLAESTKLQNVDRDFYEVVIDEWINQSNAVKEPMCKNELFIDMVEESDLEVKLHDADVPPPPADVVAHNGGLLSAVDEDKVDRVAPASYEKVLIGNKEWKKAFKDNKFHSIGDKLVGGKGLVTFVDVRTGSTGADMNTKAMGPAVLVGRKLTGMFDGG